MIDWQQRTFDVLTDPDSEEIDAAMAQLFGALHDGGNAWHTQAVEVLRQLYEHFSADPRADLEGMRWEDDPAHLDKLDADDGDEHPRGWAMRTLPMATPRNSAGAYRRAVGM